LNTCLFFYLPVLHRWVDFREEAYERANRVIHHEEGQHLSRQALHTYFFTEPASDDYLRMCVVIPQYVISYTTRKSETEPVRYVNPRHISQDPLENFFGDVKLRVGHNGLTANTVIRAVADITVLEGQRSASKLSKNKSRKRNTHRDDDEIVDTGSDELVVARFTPLEQIE
jgi:hypothetical protein